MPSGKAPTGEPGTARALLGEQWSRRRPLPAGIFSLLTVVFWAVWLYLVAPLISLLLWAFGVRLFLREIGADRFLGLRTALVSYSTALLVLVGVLALWIAWNVVRYGGSHDRRTAKRVGATDEQVRHAFHLDESLFERMRTERLVRIGLDRDGRAVRAEATPPREEVPEARADPERAAAAQRVRGST